MSKTQEKRPTPLPQLCIKKRVYILLLIIFCITCIAGMFAITYVRFERQYSHRIYPSVLIKQIPFGGKTLEETETYWKNINIPFRSIQYVFTFEHNVASISGDILEPGYDATLVATQAYLVGRSKYPLSNIALKFFTSKTNIEPQFTWNEERLRTILTTMKQNNDIAPQDALFEFKNGKVTAFKTSHAGKKFHIENVGQLLKNSLIQREKEATTTIYIAVPMEILEPAITTGKANSFGITEQIGRGYSEFSGSIPGRIHNVALAASRLNGVLIKPGDLFSFNETLGDISAATGYQSAYIIKDGRTVLGDGGGVCQVSSTLFRAALNAGLPIVERHAHAYRVHYYEDGGFLPGLDATVFDPSADLKIRNNTNTHILIQTDTNTQDLTLTFTLYGTHDGRKSEIFNHIVWDQTPPPAPLYQDDPTLPAGVIKQVDWAAWGAKASFQYKVTRGNETLEDTKFYSAFRPWQAVYLKGTK